VKKLRSYQDPCGIARAMDLLGERWAILVVRELIFGPKRFSELRRGLRGASPNVLAQRLRELEASGVLRRAAAAWELTDRGYSLHPLLLELGRWGAQTPVPRTGSLSVDALMLALETTFDPVRAEALTRARKHRAVRLALRVDRGRYSAELEDGVLSIAAGTPSRPLAVIETDSATLRAVVFADRPLAGAALALSGDLPAARAFLKCFVRPVAAIGPRAAAGP
jgi:DNA-binding HxlR family transcriptional regulator